MGKNKAYLKKKIHVTRPDVTLLCHITWHHSYQYQLYGRVGRVGVCLVAVLTRKYYPTLLTSNVSPKGCFLRARHGT